MLTPERLARYDVRMRAAADGVELPPLRAIKRRGDTKRDVPDASPNNDALLLRVMRKVSKECFADGRFAAAYMLHQGEKRIRELTQALSELARRIEARSDETPQAAQPEGREPDPTIGRDAPENGHRLRSRPATEGKREDE